MTSTTHPLCENCGECCMFIGVPPFDEPGCQPTDETDVEYRDLPAELKAEIDAAWQLKAEIDAAWQKGAEFFGGKPCIWFDPQTRLCKHYEYRPIVCAEFEPGNPVCLEDRASIAKRTNEKGA